MIKKNKKKFISTFLILFFFTMYYFLQLNWISITEETIYLSNLPEEFDEYRILQLSDLHDKEFGNGNEILVKKINQIKPDMIVITGDMLTNTRNTTNNGDVLINLLENINEDYLMYYVTGEHEEGLYYENKNKHQIEGTKEEYENKLRNLGLTVLNDEQATMIREGKTINLYGLKEHLSGEIEIEKRLGKPNKDEINILLSHRPIYFNEYSNWGADLVFSGDTHGGMIVLPFIGGIISSEKVFPEYDGGLFHKKNTTMVVNRGLGNNPIPLRINNRPEIVVITIKSS